MVQRAYVRAARAAAITLIMIGVLAMLIVIGVVGHVRPPDVAAPPAVGPQALTQSPDLTEVPAPQSPDLLQPIGDDANAWPTSDGIAAALAPYLEDLGPRAGLAVAGGGQLLYGRNAEVGFVPASTTKLVTAAAALVTLDPAARFETAVVRGAAENEIVLVGGGDPLLTLDAEPAGYPARASLTDLADQAAGALPAGRPIVVKYDASLFSGPTMAPGWRASYLSPGTAAIAPVSALAVDGGRVGRPADRVRAPDPAAAAAARFARLLSNHGLKVSLGGPTASAGDARLAAVSSPPVEAVVDVMLTYSDNDVAEVLARHVAMARGEPATFAGAARAIIEAVAEIGIDTRALRLSDGSGLSRSDVITPRALAELLTVAVRRPQLRAMLAALPVAGFTGTLHDRPADPTGDLRSPGLVRAKTGTLLGVTALAGVAYDADGRLLAFAVMADQVPAQARAEDALDAIANALATCGCG